MTSILAITDVPPQVEFPNGYSARYHFFLQEIARRWTLDLLVPHRPDVQWTRETFVPASIVARCVQFECIGANVLNGGGTASRLLRLKHYMFDSMPYLAHPRRLRTLVDLVRRTRPGLAIFFLPYCAQFALQLPLALPKILVLEEGWEGALEWTTRHLSAGLRRFVMSAEMRKVARLYRRVGRRATRVVAISDTERDSFARLLPKERIVTIEHGVDCQHFRPQEQPAEYDIAVFGILSKGANLDGALELFREAQAAALAPPRVRWGFIGASPDRSLLELRGHGIAVTGYVPDIRDHYARAQIAVVPARYGRGVKTTVLQAWAMERPVVATSFALAGLPARPGENVLVADSVRELCDRIRDLLDSPGLRQRIARAGRETVVRERDLHIHGERFTDVCAEVMSG